MTFGDMMDFLLGAIADETNSPIEDVIDDFQKFNIEIDRIKAEEGLDEEAATAKVAEYWVYKFL